MSQNDGGPAFPRPGFDGDDKERGDWDAGNKGMSLLDYFAGQALAGVAGGYLASGGDYDASLNESPADKYDRIAGIAWGLADAVLAEGLRREEADGE